MTDKKVPITPLVMVPFCQWCVKKVLLAKSWGTVAPQPPPGITPLLLSEFLLMRLHNYAGGAIFFSILISLIFFSILISVIFFISGKWITGTYRKY